jgi:CheY-like chemotaxis protein
MSQGSCDRRIGGLSILVLEDETLIYILIEGMLEELGCTAVWRAADIEAALTLLDDHRPDLAILDVNIGGESCHPVAARLDALGIPIIFSTGYGRLVMPECWQGRPVLEKPFTPADLAEALDTVLGVS